MPLIFIVLALLVPRVAIALLWLFTEWFHAVFHTAWWPILGFIFMPVTLLWYSVVQNVWGGHWSVLAIIGMVIAVLIDLSPTRGRRRAPAQPV